MKRTVMWICVVCGLLAAGAVHAEQDGWTYTLTPYVWMSGLDGDIGVGGQVSPVDESFSDLVDKIELAVMLGVEARNGAWGVFTDAAYIDLEDDENTPIGKVEVGVQQWLVAAGGLYRVVEDETMTIDVGAGARYIDTKLDIDTPVGNGSGSQGWIDPILAARMRYQVAEKVSLTLSGDIGGFGVESDLVWRLAATAGYEVSESMALLVGYRHLDYDYEDGDFVYDVATSGFGLGLSMSF